MKTLLIIVFGLWINYDVVAELSTSALTENPLMIKAVPIWVQGREKEMNLTLGFRGVFQKDKNQNCTLKITASTLYRVYLNGEFLGYGPARAAHGYFRVDEYDLSKRSKNGENIVAVEVSGYNVNSYYTLDQPSFLQAEAQLGDKIVLATGSDQGFEAFQLKERLQKVERYSYQRPFTEYYRLKKDFEQWKVSAKVPVESLKQTNLTPVKLLVRNLLLPEFNVVRPFKVCSSGKIQFRKPKEYIKDRSLTQIGDKLKGYKEDELTVLPSQIIQEITNKTQDTISKPFSLNRDISLTENEFSTFNFGINLSGFIGAKISCTETSKVFFYFDEILTNGDVNTKERVPDINNQVVYELEPGVYNLETFESYTFKYLKMIVLKGSCRILDVYLREYAYPENPKASFNCSNNKLNEIYKAARQTFRQNAVDVLTDCPSRERAGWLCDSYFSAIMEKDFTGHSAVTRNFYENYALPDSFANHPKGMIPECYPADHYTGIFIPNWAMWFVIQVNDYARRGGDPLLIARLKPRVEGILNYFIQFENENGLLENLKSWIFIDWSKANDFVQDVNYPSNMLYSAALSNAADLYHNDSWRHKSERIRQTVLKQSYNGTFFVDNAIRNKEGKLELTTNTTEVCQYYAFYFNIVTPESHPELWQKLCTEFGPARNDAITYPNVFRANAFIGNYLRMDILSRYGLKNQLMKEIQDYFYSMAQLTGTLWEKMESKASCNHGFASYLGHILYRDILGVSQIDYLKKEITVRFVDIDLSECQGIIPINESSFELKWKRSGNQIIYSIKAPYDYKVKVENLSSSELVKSE
jgi:alpha-L-rhamnosidase